MTHTFERRKLEVFFAMLTTGFGAWLLFPSVAMDSPALVHALALMPEPQWGAEAPPLPSSGMTVAGRHYRFNETELWLSIVAFDRSIWTGPPSGLAASIIRRARWPGEILPWVQPIDQFDAYFTVNKFTGQPDRVTYNGRLWRSIVANVPNVWPPGTAGIWADEGVAS